MYALELSHVDKAYADGANRVEALRDVSLALAPGELVGLMGPSGSGKSTLLNLVGLIDRPSAGTIAIAGQDASHLDDNALTRLRRRHVGYVFQFFNLLPTLSLAENVALPLVLLGQARREATRQATVLLAELGLAGLDARFPHQISGGQMQRVAIARAIVHAPALVLADEPTGNLDSANGEAILAILARLARERGQTILMATHSAEASAICQRILHLRDGRLVPHGP